MNRLGNRCSPRENNVHEHLFVHSKAKRNFAEGRKNKCILISYLSHCFAQSTFRFDNILFNNIQIGQCFSMVCFVLFQLPVVENINRNTIDIILNSNHPLHRSSFEYIQKKEEKKREEKERNCGQTVKASMTCENRAIKGNSYISLLVYVGFFSSSVLSNITSALSNR